MSGRIGMSNRFVRRLADGVVRERLLQPILATRPSLVLLSAPSGYGKTVLAAQIASSDAFRRILWVDAASSGGTLRDSMRSLADQLIALTGAITPSESEEPFSLAAEGLGRLPDDEPVAIVFDDVEWAGDTEALQSVADIVCEAPEGSLATLTSRRDVLASYGCVSSWLIDASDLLLTRAELRDLWHRALGGDPDCDRVERLLTDSSGHAALASLLVRARSIAGGDSRLDDVDPSVSEFIRALVEQLGTGDRFLLDVAAVLGSGSVTSLARCADCDCVVEGMERVARVLPLVALDKSGPESRFAVHDLVATTLVPAVSLAASDTAALHRTVNELSALGSWPRALAAATASDRREEVIACLRAMPDSSAVAEHAALIASVLDLVPMVEIARDPRLLLVRARMHWERSELSDAVRIATLASSLADQDGDVQVALQSRVQVLMWRTAMGDFDGVKSQALALLDTASVVPDVESTAVVVASGTAAAGLCGDRVALSQFLQKARLLHACSGLSGPARARMESARGVVTALLDGSLHDATLALRNAVAFSGASLCAESSRLNLTDMLLEQGTVEEAGASIATARSLSRPGLLLSIRDDLQLMESAIAVLNGDASGWRESLERVLDHAIASGDRICESSLLWQAARTAICMRDYPHALTLADRAVSSSLSTGSPILMWHAELVHAQAALASGDAARAASSAARILPRAEDLGAMGHVLHCRMILAEVARADADLAGAVEHLSRVSDYIVDQSPALNVASYLRAFPALLGPLALAMGVEAVPVRVLNLLPGSFGTDAIEQAAAVLTPAECRRLVVRMRNEAKKAAERAAAADRSDAVCRVRILGRMEVVTPTGPVADRDWCKRKARLLFAMLVAREGTDVPRGEIIEYLWPEMDEERALNNFYVVWSAMKRALAPDSVRESPCPFVEHVHGVCRVVPGRVLTDVHEFEAQLAEARAARAAGDASAELTAIRAAEELYRGDVLPGDIYDDWFAPLRTSCRHSFDDAMLRAAELLAQAGEPHQGLSMLRRPMTNDLLREDFYQAALRLQIAAGQRSEAIDTYMSCRSRLVEELGIDPSRETTQLYEQVLGMEERPA